MHQQLISSDPKNYGKPRSALSAKRRHLLLALGLICGTTLFYLHSYQPLQFPQYDLENFKRQEVTLGLSKRPNHFNNKSIGFLVDTPGCRVPDLPALSTNIKSFLKQQQPDPKCSMQWSAMSGKKKQRGPPLVQSNLTSLWVVRSAMQHYNVSSLHRLSCCYRPFWRIQDKHPKNSSKNVDDAKFDEKCVNFDGEIVSTYSENLEFVRVECSRLPEEYVSKTNKIKLKSKAEEIYRDFHAFVPLLPKVEQRCDNISQGDDQVSVLVVGVDSVSRLNMLRQLPLTYKVLMSPPFSAISLLGYNKVGDNTFPNLVPLLTGHSSVELTAQCWPKLENYFDSCPFIWKNFADRGFRTGYGEDAPIMSTFNYKKGGFLKQPTDYYTRTFFHESLKQQGHIGHEAFKFCTGPRQSIDNFFSYIKKFASRFANSRSFGFFWSSIVSHQDMNMPHIGDALLAGMLGELRDSGALDRTVLVVMSDHGMRWGSFRETYQGRMEERLPFVLLSFPELFRRRFPAAVANLQLNAWNRLTTPFDMHETLRDLLEPAARLEIEVLRARSSDMARHASVGGATDNGNDTHGLSSRGISLFLPISPHRTCEDAAISPHWCTCQTSSPVSTSTSVIKNVADFVMIELNKKIYASLSCETLHLVKIKYAEMKVPYKEGIPNEIQAQIIDYLITFETEPGNAVFEATVRKNVESKREVRAKFILAGEVSRLNAYSNQSHCISDFKLKMYCYCRKQI